MLESLWETWKKQQQNCSTLKNYVWVPKNNRSLIDRGVRLVSRDAIVTRQAQQIANCPCKKLSTKVAAKSNLQIHKDLVERNASKHADIELRDVF